MSYLKLDDFLVPGYGMTVSVSAPLKDEDASGETSSTARAKKGNKGKKIEARCSIPFRQADDLGELMRVAEATENGDGKLYTITNDTANTAGLRQGRFTSTIRADQDERLRQWNVSFSLAEHVSVPEMAESREPGKSAAPQTNEGSNIGAPAEASGGGESAGDEQLSQSEKVLKWLNDKIGPESE